ncbi:MAG TPA: phosphoglucosamine mutase [Bryobacteraceae bacterium]|nr:phosphoglucosamine mutase [Bryobacteraceae bacterium]
MGKQLFGTDGIRGVAGEYPLDAATVFAFGVALGHDAARAQSAPEILIGTDTRESARWIAEMVAGGLMQAGARVRYAGVVTTPGVAYLTRTGPFLAGVMISASHNPFQDNGLKVFAHNGFKLPDEEEAAIEHEILRHRESGIVPQAAPLTIESEWADRYLAFLESLAGRRLDGVKVVMDCGNGAAYKLGPELFRRLGAEVTALSTEPNGRNINLDCGALHIGRLRAAMAGSGADFGAAFDGDADRAILVARSGKVIDGDAVLLVLGRAMKAAGHLKEDTVVATVMSNLGLEKALEKAGIRMVRMPVGDKYVLEEMVRLGASLGGEQSGHVILREFATTGDGILTALRTIETARAAGAGLDELTADLHIYPQKLVNIRVREKKLLTEVPAVAREIEHVETAFAGTGRVLVRFSGTEPLARVMVEGQDAEQVEAFTTRIADAIRLAMGA